MANIAISDLRPTGANLFQDSESFMHELTEQDIADVLGGRFSIYIGASYVLCITF
ncbi:hypothetical protein [Tolypothrix sp. VBCCA 56010]|uniref:hypothetical protein n=1 Tax=Tolypothrix sp. VBCCA 56010 TaxID=3137731 RepID=UPI003D7CE5EA